MSHFYGDLQGSRGMVTRQGGKNTGIQGHIRGWSLGARVYFHHDAEAGQDYVTIYLTCGSGYGAGDKLIGVFSRADFERQGKWQIVVEE